MSVRVHTVTFDCTSPDVVSEFWRELLGYHRTDSRPGTVMIVDAAGRPPALLFVPSDNPKNGRNQIHLDLRAEDHGDPVAKALSLGAVRTSVGQKGNEAWTVLTDPEGNEFCILQSKEAFDRYVAEFATAA